MAFEGLHFLKSWQVRQFMGILWPARVFLEYFWNFRNISDKWVK